MASRVQVRGMTALMVLALGLPSAAFARFVAHGGPPLRLTERVLRSDELVGFVPKARPTSVWSLRDWNKLAPSGGIDVTKRLSRAGFIAGVREDLKWSKGDDRGALSVAVRLGSAKLAAAEIAQQLKDFAGEPARGRAKSYTAFAVKAIPGSHGFTLVSGEGAGHNIIWADGPFVYHVGVGWGQQANDPPTREQLIAAASHLYQRVHGRSAPTR